MASPLIIGSLFELGKSILDRVFPDEQEKAKAEIELLRLTQEKEFKELDAQLQMALAQTEVNKIEAASDSLYKSGWRPTVGWICASGLGYQYIISPIVTGIGMNLDPAFKAMPSLDLSDLLPLLFGLLGLGAYRTFERVKKK